MTKTQQKDVIEWAIQKLEDYENEKKLYNLSAIILSALDVICGIIALLHAGMMVTSVVASILCGSVWGARYIQLKKVDNFAKALKLLSMPSIAYLAARKRRGEIMSNIKIKNWIVAILNVVAVITGVVLIFVEPNAITNNIEAVIAGVSALLGVNVAIPCFNNAKVSAEEKAEKNANKKIKAAEKQAKAIVKEKQKAEIESIKADILANAKVDAINVENQVINAEHVEINNANVETVNTQN